jgi:hypothetical protein
MLHNVRIVKDGSGTVWHYASTTVHHLPGLSGTYTSASLWAAQGFISYSWSTLSSSRMGVITPHAKNFSLPATGITVDPTSLRAIGEGWCLNGTASSVANANSFFGSTLFDSSDLEGGVIKFDNYSFSPDFTEVERRTPWNRSVIRAGWPVVATSDQFEATSPFRFMVVTMNDSSSDHEDDILARIVNAFVAGGEVFGMYGAQHARLMDDHFHYPLVGATADFDLRFKSNLTQTGPGQGAGNAVNDLTEDHILVLATGTVTHDPISSSDISDLGSGVYRVTVNNVSGGPEGGLLSLSLRADKDIYGALGTVRGNVPPRVPAVYQEVYDVPADP